MNHFVEAEVYQACRLLFGSELRLNREFLRYLQPKGAKQAYRKRAKEHHPDRYAQQHPQIHRKQVRHFQDINRAYDLIVDFLNHRQPNHLPLVDTPHSPLHRRSPTARPQPNSATRPCRASDCYRGPMPHRRLEFGLFLYYRGLIPFRSLLTALSWQRQQRPNLGDLAIRWGWMNPHQIDQVCRYRPHGGQYKRFGERAVALEVIDQRQLQTLLFYQRSLQSKLGEYFIEQRLFTRVEIDRLLREQASHNRQYPLPPLNQAF